jgi:hypothetical protein
VNRRPSVLLTDIANDASINQLLQIWQDLVDEMRART